MTDPTPRAALAMPLISNEPYPEGLEHLDNTRAQIGFKDMGDYAIFTQNIVKSDHDDSDYALIRLKNGLEAMIVHDPKADMVRLTSTSVT